MAFWCFRCRHYIHNGSPEFHNIFCRPRINNSSRGNHINNNYNSNRNPSYNNSRNNNNSNRNNLAPRNRNHNNNRYNRDNHHNIRRRDNNNRYHNHHRNNNNRHNYHRTERRHQNRINNITYNHANNDNNNRNNDLVEHLMRRVYLNNLLGGTNDFRGNNEGNNNNGNNDNNNNNEDNNNELSESIIDSFESRENNNHGIDEEVLWRLPKSKIPDVNKLEKKQCNICLADYKNGDELTTLPCFHFFHPNCINQWLISKNICPVCKFEIKLNNRI